MILNLQGTDIDLLQAADRLRLGVTCYALDGGMQRIADKVFLLPRATSRSRRKSARLIEKGFFNQS